MACFRPFLRAIIFFLDQKVNGKGGNRMKLLTEMMPHLLLYGLVCLAGLLLLVFLFWGVVLTFSPFIWISEKIRERRCPQCKGFFKRELAKWEIADEREVLRTVDRVDQGVVYSNHLLEPNHAIEINRKEQVTFVEKTILNHWVCKNSECGHHWQTEEFQEYEGSLNS